MHGLLVAAAALLTACTATTPAGAQAAGDYTGTWAFQTEPYGNDQFGVVMSGVAIMRSAGANRYTLQVVTNELIIERQTSQSRLLTARQNCTGQKDDAQFTVTCAMAEPLEGYEPDNFVLQAGENADQLVGALSSATSSTVTFTRVR